MKPYLIAGNWKMNGRRMDLVRLASDIRTGVEALGPECRTEVLICAQAPLWTELQAAMGDVIGCGGQDVSEQDPGARTGEISAEMLRDHGVRYVIVGHSERRQFHHEGSPLVALKAQKALSLGVTPIVCVGETAEQRDAGHTKDVVKQQLAAVIHQLQHCISEIVVAYEPVWAIGTGRSASPEQAQEVHHILRQQLMAASQHGKHVRLLYGGSLNPGNAAAVLAQPDIDGGLIGGASLKAPDFLSIVQAAEKQACLDGEQ